MYCKEHDQIMEFRDKSFICAKCDAERGARFRGMFQLMTTGAPLAAQGKCPANDTPSLQEAMGLPLDGKVKVVLAEYRARAERAEKELGVFKGQLDNGWRMVPWEPTEAMIDVIVKLKTRRVHEAVNHGTEGPGARAAAREEWLQFLGAAPWPSRSEG